MGGMDYYYPGEVAARATDNPTSHAFDGDAEPGHYRGYETDFWERDSIDAPLTDDYSSPGAIPLQVPQYSLHSASSSHAFERGLPRHSRYPPSHGAQVLGQQNGAETSAYSNGHSWGSQVAGAAGVLRGHRARTTGFGYGRPGDRGARMGLGSSVFFHMGHKPPNCWRSPYSRV
jgi:hypothetical protein